MSCNNEIHVNDIGTEFQVTIVKCEGGITTPIDISSATLKELVFKKPGSAGTIAKTAVFTPVNSGGTGDGTDGKISYFTLDNDLVPNGTYSIQGIVTTPAGKWSSNIDKFTVTKNLL